MKKLLKIWWLFNALVIYPFFHSERMDFPEEKTPFGASNTFNPFEVKLGEEEKKAAYKDLDIPENYPPGKAWELIELYFRERGLTYIKLESYDLALENFKKILQSNPPIQVEDKKSQGVFQYSFGNVAIISPSFTPQEARLRRLNYNVTLVADVIQGCLSPLKKFTQKVFPNQKICEIPLMLRSKHCHLFNLNEDELIEKGECIKDIGGYFIVNGKEKVIINQERIEYNRLYVWTPSKNDEKKNYLFMAEVRSLLIRGSKPAILKIFLDRTGKNFSCSVPGLKEHVQVGLVLHALGFVCGLWQLEDDTTEQIRKMICPDDDQDILEYVEKVLVNSDLMRNENALTTLGQMAPDTVPRDKRIDFIIQLLEKETLIHIPKSKKVQYLAYMIYRLILVTLKRRSEDDRDNLANKRIDTDGALLEDLFRGFLENYITNVKAALSSHPTNHSILERDFTITTGFHSCMATGNWGVIKNGFKKVGVCQALSRLSYIGAVSHLRRAISNRSSRATKPRYLHSSHFGVFDPTETPEGEMSGILKNITIASHITTGTSETPIYGCLAKCPEFSDKLEEMGLTKVFVNGVLAGVSNVPGMLLARMRDFRARRLIHHETSISYLLLDREIHIYSDSGRTCRPLCVVKNKKLLLDGTITADSWHDYLEKGLIRYVDSIEEQTSLIAMFPSEITEKTAYCEIHPALILAVSCSIIPFPNHNQSPRLSYSASMSKQSIGIYVTNYLQRFDTTAYVAGMPQRPLVHTRLSDLFGHSDMPSGFNAIVALMMYSGGNQEDSVILNKASIDRGMFCDVVYKTYSAEEKNQDNTIVETIEAPDNSKLFEKNKNFLKLDHQGIIKEGSEVCEGDVLIRKTIRREGRNSERSDISVVHKLEEKGFVDKVLITRNASGNKMVQVRVGYYRPPTLGDKFASVHAQKGTVGMILPPEDMPFTADGVIPDIIINPLCIVSRMTISHLIECVTGKATALSGIEYDCTPFVSDLKKNNTTSFTNNEMRMVKHLEDVGNVLRSNGFHQQGEEAMYSGFTGELLEGTVFIGPTYYRRLKHMINDKLSARAEGPHVSYTREAANHGRKNGKKLTSIRFGTMETDAMVSHGAGLGVQERLLHSGDKYEVEVCDKCGMIGPEKTACKCGAGSTNTVMPYSFKLLHHNITALMIAPRLKTNSGFEKDIEG
jgi:DNA-directed RNA polymerase II subunit RPB2